MSLRYKAGFITESYDPLLVPDAPTIGTATAGSTTASVTFTAPSNVGGGAITGYIATAYDSSGNAISTTGSSSPITVTGLTNNTAYTIKVAATNAYGTGAYSAASNSVTPVPPYIEDVFSTYLYTGNDSTQTITNGIDLSGKGGLVWEKSRTLGANHLLWDSSRGTYKLSSNLTDAQVNNTIYAPTFTSTGYISNYGWSSANNIASWTFRKQPKFFDIVTYTGDGASSRAISHNLGSVPGCIIVKRTNNVGDWETYHRGLNGGVNPQNCKILLNSTGAQTVGTGAWASTSPTSSVFYTNGTANTNDSGATYVAYLFAHDAGGFGNTGNDNVISCGSFTGTGSNITVSLGYQPQWILMKRTDSAGDWQILDTMRQWNTYTTSAYSSNTALKLAPNSSTSETGPYNLGEITSTGFFLPSTVVGSGENWVYVAIRRPMKTPTVGTSVFSPVSSTSTFPSYKTNFPVDMAIRISDISTTHTNYLFDRLRGDNNYLETNTTAAAVQNGTLWVFDYNTGWAEDTPDSAKFTWNFQRAPGFFDVVCYLGNGSNRTINHNLGVAPELIIIKSRDATAEWITSVPDSGWGNTEYLIMNNTFAKNNYGALNVWNATAPTSSVFSLGTISSVNLSSTSYIAYLFASCPGVSKVGSYTGTGTTQTINCGFTTGARFVMIKRTDSTGDWWVWDSARGMVSGTNPRLALNTTAAQSSSNWVLTASNGFEIVTTNASVNANGGTFIYLAIA